MDAAIISISFNVNTPSNLKFRHITSKCTCRNCASGWQQFSQSIKIFTYSLVHKEILNKVPFWASCTEPLSTLSTSKNCLIFRNILNFIWALIFFQNIIWFLNCNQFSKTKFFSLKSSLVKKFQFWETNCSSKTG